MSKEQKLTFMLTSIEQCCPIAARPISVTLLQSAMLMDCRRVQPLAIAVTPMSVIRGHDDIWILFSFWQFSWMLRRLLSVSLEQDWKLIECSWRHPLVIAMKPTSDTLEQNPISIDCNLGHKEPIVIRETSLILLHWCKLTFNKWGHPDVISQILASVILRQ